MSRSSSPGWITTDEEEIAARRARAAKEEYDITCLSSTGSEAAYPFVDFQVSSASLDRHYHVEIRSLNDRDNACACKDYLTNGLGTCKHIEAVLASIRRSQKPVEERSPRIEIYLSRRGGSPAVRIHWPDLPSGKKAAALKVLAHFFTSFGDLVGKPLDAIPAMVRAIGDAPVDIQSLVRVSRHVGEWGRKLRRADDRERARTGFLEDLATGVQRLPPLRRPLYPYQREGMIHLAFGERAMLADEMGLGKTVQAIAATELLVQRKDIERVLVICPASLKAEWAEQIELFCEREFRVVTGNPGRREAAYQAPVFYTLVNYEQVRNDAPLINQVLMPDLVILDEAQRIKNWSTKTARAVKSLLAPYTFVLTGTPIENRIDEVFSIAEFIDPQLFGPLFRFNREFYELNEAGRPVGFRNLPELHRRIRSIMVRRRKDEVEEELPDRTINNYYVDMTARQRETYEEMEKVVARLASTAAKRALLAPERIQLQRNLACMRMLCDSPYILDQDVTDCPKLDELEALLEGLLPGNDQKVLIFSEWVKMLDLVARRLDELNISFASHTGEQSQNKRREEIQRFREHRDCRILLSSDTGSTGLNLQAASIVINLDLPWNPAKLEQRIARAWRKAQTRSVTVINLICQNSIEHRMLAKIATKQALSEAVLDARGEFDEVELKPGSPFLRDLTELLDDAPIHGAPGGEALRQALAARLGSRLIRSVEHEEHVLLLVDELDAHVRSSVPETVIVVDLAGAKQIHGLEKAGLLTCNTRLAELLELEPNGRFADPETLEKIRGLLGQIEGLL